MVGLAGGIAGLVVGLKAYPPTAVFAAFELGLPSAFLGCWFGLLCGAVASLALDRDADRARDTARGADALVAAVTLLAAALLLVALRGMDWATRTGPLGRTPFHGGPTVLLTGAALASCALALALVVIRSTRWRRGVRVLLLAAALLTAGATVGVALSRIAAANTIHSAMGGTTSYGFGALVGVVAAVVMLAAVTVRLLTSLVAPRPGVADPVGM